MGNSGSHSFNYEKQLLSDTKVIRSTELSDTVTEISGPIHRNVSLKDSLIKYPLESENGGYKTIWECFQRGVNKFPDHKFFGTRPYVLDSNKKYTMEDGVVKRGDFIWESYSDIDKSTRAFGAGLVKLGAKAQDNIGIFANNRAEWVITQLGMYSQSMRCVSLYATLGAEAVEFICNHADVAIVAVEKANLPHLLKLLPKLKLTHIIQFDVNEKYCNVNDVIDEDAKKTCADANVQLIGFSEVLKLGEGGTINPPTPDDYAYVMYTSGTTGNPKGALLRHSNIVASVASVPFIIPLNENDSHLSYLPLAHIFETVVQVALMCYGGSIGFFQNNIKMLTNDIIALQPTLLCGVPRVFSRIYQVVFAGVNSKNCIVKWYFNKAYQSQANHLRVGEPRNKKYDDKVFIPLRTKIGLSKCKYILTGAAPCPPYLLEFLKVAVGAVVLQGYGMTETAAGIAITNADDNNVGHVGPNLPCCEVKLVDIPDMEYLHTDKPHPRGEIWVRGPNIFAGYYKDEKTTESTLTKDGWLQTGDVGRWNPNGTLSIIDRKKNMFKLSQGEYIAVERIEQQYSKSPIVGQLFVYGNSFKSFLVAVIVPSADAFSAYAVEKGWWPNKDESKLGHENFSTHFKNVLTGPHKDEIKTYILSQLREQEKVLKGFEKIMDIIVESDIDRMGAGFTEANGCLTPTFKLRRPQLLQRYIGQLKELYGKNGEPVAADEKWPGED